MRVDYHVHGVAHGEYKYELEWIEQYVNMALDRGIKEIGFSEHNEFAAQIDDNLLNEIQNKHGSKIKIRLGLESDFFPGKEEEIKAVTKQRAYDYIIGSVHFIDGWGFDHPDFKKDFDKQDIDEIYLKYAALLTQMVQSNCFDVVGHLDLLKIWGHRPCRQSSSFYFDSVLKAVREHGLAVEINTAGLRKPVGELYPAPEIINKMFAYDIPITFGSDAHLPEQVGEGLSVAYRAAWQAGYRYLVRFERHNQIVTAIDY